MMKSVKTLGSVKVLRGASALAALLAAGLAQGQVQVNAGETLTESDLSSGTFMGQGFSLDPSTVFDINDGGVIGPVGDEITPIPFDFGGSTVNINAGGVFQNGFFTTNFVSNVVLNVFDSGSVAKNFRVGTNTTMNISGGSVGESLLAVSGSTVSISGGSVDSEFSALSGSTVNLSGGSVEDQFFAFDGSEVNISGGSVGRGFQAQDGSTLNLFVTDISINRAAPTGLVNPGDSMVITQRDGAFLAAVLIDGSVFDLVLNDTLVIGDDFIEPGATLTVTLETPPTSTPTNPLDFNGDGSIDIADVIGYLDAFFASP